MERAGVLSTMTFLYSHHDRLIKLNKPHVAMTTFKIIFLRVLRNAIQFYEINWP